MAKKQFEGTNTSKLTKLGFEYLYFEFFFEFFFFETFNVGYGHVF